MTSLSELTETEVLTKGNLGGLDVLPVSEQRRTANILIYGGPGVGKTVLAGSASVCPEMGKVLIIDIEGGTMSLQNTYPNCDVVRIRDWAEMQKVYDELYEGNHDYGTVVLDSLTEIQKFSMYLIMEELLRSDPSRDPDIPSIREWGKNIEQTRRVVRAFRDLPVNTILTALAKAERNPKTGMTHTSPALSGRLANEVAGFLDIVGYMYMKTVEGEIQRLLLTAPTETEVAKDRTGQLPAVLEAPTMAALVSAVFTNKEQTT